MTSSSSLSTLVLSFILSKCIWLQTISGVNLPDATFRRSLKFNQFWTKVSKFQFQRAAGLFKALVLASREMSRQVWILNFWNFQKRELKEKKNLSRVAILLLNILLSQSKRKMLSSLSLFPTNFSYFNQRMSSKSIQPDNFYIYHSSMFYLGRKAIIDLFNASFLGFLKPVISGVAFLSCLCAKILTFMAQFLIESKSLLSTSLFNFLFCRLLISSMMFLLF